MKNDPLRILVAEDSPTARRLLVEIVRADPALTVVGEARDGVEAVELAQRLRPSLVTMDIQMPRMDGLEATRRIMTEVPTPVVVVSTLVERDIQTSMAALRAGALAVLQKPLGPESPDFDADSRRLRDTLKAMAEVKVVRRWPDSAAGAQPGGRGDETHGPRRLPRLGLFHVTTTPSRVGAAPQFPRAS
ncbi:response regulator, partial [Myxococcus xanthus]|uniref:response regulator n=1 Tax=Myxococcus xanthus TaxID=34 RepID=UPI0020A5397D